MLEKGDISKSMDESKEKEFKLEKGRPKVAVSITAETPADIVAQCEALRKAPCDMIEWRADYYLSAIEGLEEWLGGKDAYVDIVKILDDMDFIAQEKPIIFTIRSISQGGRVQITRPQLESIYSIAAQSKLADYVDIELFDKEGKLHEDWIREQIEEVHRYDGKVILSHHDFETMPGHEDIVEIIGIMHELGADVCKFAAIASSREEAQSLLKTSVYLDGQGIGPLVMIAMGEHGTPARVAGGKYGSVITFASAAESSAPGQLDVYAMKKWLDDYYGEGVQ